MCYHSNNYSVLITLFSFQRSATFEDSNVHTPVYFFIDKKTPNVHFFTYIRKNLFELPEVHTRPYTRTPNSVLKFCAQILCSNSVLPVLSFSSSSSLARCGDYLSHTARCGILSLMHSAVWDIISHITTYLSPFLSCVRHKYALLHISNQTAYNFNPV